MVASVWKKSMLFFALAFCAGCAADASEAGSPAVSVLPQRLGDTPVENARIVVYKEKRTLVLYSGDTAVASFPVGLGSSPVGHKQREGDGKTPEGGYYVCTRNDRSRFYLSLGLSYPNAYDAKAAYDRGVIDGDTCNAIVDAVEHKKAPPWDTPLGGEIMIHGCGATDWTAGCIAVDNGVMDILWRHCPLGTPVTILP